MQEEEKRERRDRISYFGIKGLSDRDLVRNILSPFEIPEAKEKAAVEGVLGILDKESTVRIENLTAIPEITHQAARIIVSAIEIGRRWPTRKERQIKTPDDAYAEIRHYATRPQENLIVMALNGAHEIIFTEVVSIGTVNMTYAHPREIFSNAVRNRATVHCARSKSIPRPLRIDEALSRLMEQSLSSLRFSEKLEALNKTWLISKSLSRVPMKDEP